MSSRTSGVGDPGMTRRQDRFYSRIASAYSWWTRLPPWRQWIESALPEVVGRSVLEVSFGPGWLLPILAETRTVFGIDFNRRMCETAKTRLELAGSTQRLAQGNVEALPFPSGSFDCVLNTMAFSGYPHAGAAMAELMRVLRPGGRLVLLDFVSTDDLGVVGKGYVKLAIVLGDVMRDMDQVFEDSGLSAESKVIGAGGSLKLFWVDKPPV